MGLQASISPKNRRRRSTKSLDQTIGPAEEPPATLQRTVLTLSTALSLYGLTDSELFWELQLDTRCLMGWSSSKIVVSFRGTASVRNAMMDMQVIHFSFVCLLLPVLTTNCRSFDQRCKRSLW